MALHPLRRLEASIEAGRRGEAAAPAQRLSCLRQLERLALPRAGQVLRLHEALCFLRAYPGDAAVLARAKRGVHLVNVARGALVDQEALRAAVLAGADGTYLAIGYGAGAIGILYTLVIVLLFAGA